MSVTISWHHIAHSAHVQHLCALVVGYPESLEAILGKTLASLAANVFT